MNYLYKRKLYHLILISSIFLLLIVFCLFLNRNVSSIKSVSNLLDVVTSYAGFNYFVLHGTIYNMAFGILLVFALPDINIQNLARIERSTIIKQYVLKIFIESVLFITVFTGAYILVVLMKFGWSFTVMTNFFTGVLFQFIMLILLYQILGTFYLVSYIYNFSKSHALFSSIICSMVLVCLTLLFGIWTPFKDIEIFNSFYNHGLSLIQFLVRMVRDLIIYLALNYIALILFKAKDILNHE